MFAPRIVLTLVLALSLGACHRDRCLSVCEQRQKELGCNPVKTCKQTCDELHEPSVCDPAFHAWEDCMVKLPADQWECGIRGQPVPKEKACKDARVQVMSCISKYPEWPLPKKQ
jgi:hypothetical protein